MKNEDNTQRPTIAEAAEVVTELRDALVRVGIVLPSLGLDAVTLAAEPPRPLVELGRCTVETARRIAAALVREGERG